MSSPIGGARCHGLKVADGVFGLVTGGRPDWTLSARAPLNASERR